MKNARWIKEWSVWMLMMRTNNSLECRNFGNNTRFGAHPQFYKWCRSAMRMYSNGWNDYVLWKATGNTRTQAVKERKKNGVLVELWKGISEKLKVVKRKDGKIIFDDSEVSDGDLLHFLYTSSKGLKVGKEALEQMIESLRMKNERCKCEK